MPAIPDARTYSFASPNTGAEAIAERDAATRMASGGSASAQLAFVHSTALGAFATLDRVGSVVNYQPGATYPNTGLGLALRTVAGAMARATGTRVFWVSTGGFDNHSNEGNAGGGTYAKPDGDRQRCRVCVLQRPQGSGTAEQHAHRSVLRVRPPYFRKRQPGNRSRCRGPDARHRRHRAWWTVRHRGIAGHRSCQPDAREQRRRCSI